MIVAELQQNIHIIIVFENMVKGDNVFVLESFMDFYFGDQLEDMMENVPFAWLSISEGLLYR
jgi:sulfate adenylyltransferase subunit 1 (EFTu-like GTPase family)